MNRLQCSSKASRYLGAMFILLCVTWIGCSNDPAESESDASIDAASDAEQSDARKSCVLPTLTLVEQGIQRWSVGKTRTVALGLNQPMCEGARVVVNSSNTEVIDLGEMESQSGRVILSIPFVAKSVGQSEISIRLVDTNEPQSAGSNEISLSLVVEDDNVQRCEGEQVQNILSPGEEVVGPAGASISFPEGAADPGRYQLSPIQVSVECATSLVDDGSDKIALSPAVSWSATTSKFPREVRFSMPIDIKLLPDFASARHIEILYRQGNHRPRVVPVSNLNLSDDGNVSFWAPRLGIYQAVVERDAAAVESRETQYESILGISMGAGGAAMFATRYPEKVDAVAALGGPVDWIATSNMIRDYLLGGFCQDGERGDCDSSSFSRTPSSPPFLSPTSHFESWNYPAELGTTGNGGIFGRDRYIRLFRDLSAMFGNPNSGAELATFGAPGIGRDELLRGDRCRIPFRIPNGYYDDEYNPEGSLPVVSFCDGGEGDVIGKWDPNATNDVPLDILMAVDRNENGRRDPGEPVIRSFWEPFADCGLDNLCNADEPGFDPLTNPDPSGDDFDYQYNPNGSEKNGVRDGDRCGDGEHFEDAGLDGVMNTKQLAERGYDAGEGDGCWTTSSGFAAMLDNNPRARLGEALSEVDFYFDGGVRDLFGFASAANFAVSGGLAAGIRPHLFNNLSAVNFENPVGDAAYSPQRTRADFLPRFSHVRYGNIDKIEADGDGGHVGSLFQIVTRLTSAMYWLSARWPDAPRVRAQNRLCDGSSAECSMPTRISSIFSGEKSGRSAPLTVHLPPGYHDDNEKKYPVIYFLHGYGGSSASFSAQMESLLRAVAYDPSNPLYEQAAAAIWVFPDGHCLSDECEDGTFYVDSKKDLSHGAQMQTYLLDVMAHVRSTYRVMTPKTIQRRR